MDSEPLKVLLVEDDEDDYFLTGEIFSEIEGGRYDLDWASSYEEGLARVECREHDIYLFDYRLGEHNGLDLLREAIASGCDAPIILLTGQGDREVDLEAMKSGAADFLPKGQLSPMLLERSIRYAIERRKTLNLLHRLSTHDELTGLYNRREMNRIFHETFLRSRRYDRPMSLIMIDVDHFKQINDTYGHLGGDEVLRQLGEHFRDQTRNVDYLARYGGEEIALILPETALDDAFLLATRLCRSVAETTFVYASEDQGTLVIPVTVSLGVASFPEHAKTEQALISAADQALYEAKRTGRNQALCYVDASKQQAFSIAAPEIELIHFSQT